jgi:hypothetical protein
MARLPLPPTPQSFTPIKKEPDTTTTASAHTPHPLTRKKPRQDRLPLPVTPTQPLLKPQVFPSGTSIADSFTIKRCRELGLTPETLPTSIKREPDADAGADDTAGGKTLVAPPSKKHRRHGLPATPSQPHFTPQTTLPGISTLDFSAGKWSEYPGPTPTTASASVKREPGTDTCRDARGKSVVERRRPYPHARPTAAETPTMWLNRSRLGRLLHNLVRAHRWRDAAGVFSALLPGIQRPDSFEEAHNIFVVSRTCRV